MSVYEFLRTIAAQLGDDRPGSPFRRYALKDLVAYYQEAMCFVSAHRPDLFTDFVVMKLKPGSYQDARCCGCTNVIQVVAQIDADGNTIKDLTTTGGGAKADVTRWFRPVCRTVNGTSVTLIDSITITPGMNGSFQVFPAIKPGQDVWVKLKCVHAPPSPSEADVLGGGASTGDCKFLPAIRSYVLYRALQGDRHAVGATTEAQNELKNVYTYLGMQYKMEQAQENQ